MTIQREEKYRRVLAQRQSDLTVIIDNVHDPHNVSAVMRSCDAVGIREIYLIQTTPPSNKYKFGKRSSASAIQWVIVHRFDNVEECVQQVRKKYEQILTTHMSESSKSLYDLNLTSPVALAFGNERDGVSPELMNHSDGNFIIPMMGMIPSLNISVAAGVSLFEAMRQRNLKGMFNKPKLTETEMKNIFDFWVDRDLRG